MSIMLIAVVCSAAPAAAQGQPPIEPAPEVSPAVSEITSESNPLAAVPRCYIGPVTVKVVDDEGRPVPNAVVGLFGAIWKVNVPGGKASRVRDRRSDENGMHRAESVQECNVPTFVYAADEPSGRAGITWIRELDELKSPKTVRLTPARRVFGVIEGNSNNAIEHLCHFVPQVWAVFVAPIQKGEMNTRHLKYIRSDPGRFEFLLPPGQYQIDASVAGSTYASVEFEIIVPDNPDATETCFDLGVISPCRAWQPNSPQP